MTPTTGNMNADVTLVEFFDYQCGYCKQVAGSLIKLIENDKKLRVVWKELPILGPNSRFAATAAMALRAPSPSAMLRSTPMLTGSAGRGRMARPTSASGAAGFCRALVIRP